MTRKILKDQQKLLLDRNIDDFPDLEMGLMGTSKAVDKGLIRESFL